MLLLRWRLLLAAYTVFCIHTASSASQQLIDYLGANLQVQYRVHTNLEDGPIDAGPRCKATLQLTNIGDRNVTSTDWGIYLCSVRIWQPDEIRKQLPGTKAELGRTGLTVEHVQGCLHKLSAIPGRFKGFVEGMTLIVPFETSEWQAARTDVSPNWYAASNSDETVVPATLFYTADETLAFVDEFTTPEQWKRRAYDAYDPYSAADRYRLTAPRESALMPVLPTPREWTVLSERFVDVHSGGWTVVSSSGGTKGVAEYLADRLLMKTASASLAPESHYVYLQLGTVSEADGSRVIPSPDAYQLLVDPEANVISVRGSSVSGLLYGAQSLLSMVRSSSKIHEVAVVDYPRYPYRGVHVDVARNFLPKKSVLTLLEVMATYKMNKLHLHLSDDEGWRLEIPGLPELTEVGGRRCHDLTEKRCILSQLGSGPESDNSGSGFYSTKDYNEILRHAAERSIQVIPEFDMPGHGHAAIKSMEARYDRLYATDPAAAVEYLLSDLNDTSRYVSVQYFRDNAINPCLSSTYAFVRKLVRELKSMHESVQPLQVFHFGGDEVPEGAWTKSRVCGGRGAQQLKQRFVRKVASIVHDEGVWLAGWEDGLMSNSSTPYDRDSIRNDEVFGYAWNNIWEWGGGSRAYTLANAGYKVILSHATDLYFDHPHEPDPEERGFYWASRYTSTRDVFNYMPTDIYRNIQVDLWGKPLHRDNVCRSMGCVPLNEDSEQNILGMQAQVWSETVRTPDQFFSMLLPRMLAVAERAWHAAPWESFQDVDVRNKARDEDWAQFANTLGYKELGRLDDLDVIYNIPRPGAVVTADGLLHARTSLPGLPIEYSTDGGDGWKPYTAPAEVPYDSVVRLRTRSASGKRTSRMVNLRTPTSPPSGAGGRAALPTPAHPAMTVLLVMLTALSLWMRL